MSTSDGNDGIVPVGLVTTCRQHLLEAATLAKVMARMSVWKVQGQWLGFLNRAQAQVHLDQSIRSSFKRIYLCHTPFARAHNENTTIYVCVCVHPSLINFIDLQGSPDCACHPCLCISTAIQILALCRGAAVPVQPQTLAVC